MNDRGPLDKLLDVSCGSERSAYEYSVSTFNQVSDYTHKMYALINAQLKINRSSFRDCH